MKKILKIALPILLSVVLIAAAAFYFSQNNVDVLNPQGDIARQQRDLILFTVILGMFVIVPVFVMLGLFAWKFREGNTKAKYRPDWDEDNRLEAIWWGIPIVIIAILSVITWQTSHSLDPYRKLDSDVKPIEVQVVAMQWKWLFIYPEQKVASVNVLQIPEKTPVNFTITSDAPMNTFWIPSLGGQVYAMSGMSTKLHLIADKAGEYKGSSTNISGEGFADMKFIARATSRADFNDWVDRVKVNSSTLDQAKYDKLAQPAVQESPSFYTINDLNLYDRIVMKYMAPMNHEEEKKDEATEQEVPTEHDHSKMDHSTHNMEGM